MNETECPTCKFPAAKSRDHRLSEAAQFHVPRSANTLLVANFGEVPVLKGDVSWLSPQVIQFLNECIPLTTPSAIRICNGSVFEAGELRDAVVHEFRNDAQKRLDRLHLTTTDIGYDDVHVITRDRQDAEPDASPSSSESSQKSDRSSCESGEDVRLSAHFMTAKHFEYTKEKRFQGCMTGRTMYVVPFCMGWIGGRRSLCAVQVTDDPVLVLHLRTTFRVLPSVWDLIARTTIFVKSVHTIGMPRPVLRTIVKTPPVLTPIGSHIVLKHDEQQVWAHGPSFGRNFRFGKTFSIHAASWIGTKNGWLAENAALLSITNPKNETIHVCYSSLTSVESLGLKEGVSPGWKIEVLSSRTVWLQWHEGRLHAFAPENDEMSEQATPQNLRYLLAGSPQDYRIQTFNPQNSKWSTDLGVPIAAYIFANKRHDRFPLILETNTWQEGVVLAAGMRVTVKKRAETSDASTRPLNLLTECPMLRVDPIHFSFAKYVNHWLDMGIAVGGNADENPMPPPIFFTNLYQELDGKVIWPGGPENAKIFEYIHHRCTNPMDLSNVTSCGLGYVPKTLDLNHLVNLPALLEINVRFWLQELSKLRNFFAAQMGANLPGQLDKVLTDLAAAV